jgi:hypothetical protein
MQMTIENIAEFNNLIADLDDSIKKEVMKKGYAKAAQPLIAAARANTTSKRIQKSLGVKYYADGNYADVGARKTGRYAGFMGLFFEEGTKERMTKTQTKIFKRKVPAHSTGMITATHFFSKAVDQTSEQIFNNLYETFVETYNRVVKKYEKYYK